MFVLLFGFRGVAANGADVKLARLANPGIALSGRQQGDGLGIEACVGLLGFQGSVKVRMAAVFLRSVASARKPGYMVSISYCSPSSAALRFSSVDFTSTG